MTVNQMSKLGFYVYGIDKYCHPNIPEIDFIRITKKQRLENLIFIILEKGKEIGRLEGKEEIQNLFKSALNL